MKKVFLSLSFTVGLLLSGLAQSSDLNTRLNSGNELSQIPLNGKVHVRCMNDGSDSPLITAHYDCQENYYLPAEYVRIVTESFIEANRLVALFTNAQGKTQELKLSFETKKNRSERIYWLNPGWFKGALFSVGLNQVKVRFFQNKKLLAEDNFEVSLSEANARSCPEQRVESTNYDDCNSSMNVCRNALLKAAPSCQ